MAKQLIQNECEEMLSHVLGGGGDDFPLKATE